MEKTYTKENALRSFVQNFRKQELLPHTVQTYARRLGVPRTGNHEVWRTCRDCGEEFDVRITLQHKCPACGSLRIA